MSRNNHHNLVSLAAEVAVALVLVALLLVVLMLAPLTAGAFFLVEDNHKKLIHMNNRMSRRMFHCEEVVYLC